MEGKSEEIVAAIQSVIDEKLKDPGMTCAYCQTPMEFRIDQFTRQEGPVETWAASAVILRSDGWMRLVVDGKEVGVVCPTCQSNNMKDARIAISLK